MSAGWAAGGVRARALARRPLGAGPARALAATGSLDEALRMLAGTSYAGRVQPGQDLQQAQHAIAAGLLWNLRVLAGWVPRGGLPLFRVFAGWFEIANIDESLQEMAGLPAGPRFDLGALATAWPRLRDVRSPAALRAALAASAWGDPGGDSALAIRLRLRLRLAERAAGLGGPVLPWAAGGAALLVAGERFGGGRDVPAVAAGLLGRPALGAATLAEMAAGLPATARWTLAGIQSPQDLWRAEAAWWARVEADGHALLRAAQMDSSPVIGVVAVLAADGRRVSAALGAAARGGGPPEAYDAVA